MKNKRICFSDVDGTIYEYPNRNLLEEVKNSVLFAKEKNNIEFVLNTGNPLLPKIFDLAKELNSNYIIAGSGTQIYDCRKNELIYKKFIYHNEGIKVLEIAKDFNLTAFFYDEDNLYLFNSEESTKKFLENFMDYHDWKITNKLPKNIFKIELISSNKNLIDAAFDRLNSQKLLLNIENLKSYIEIVPDKTSKGSGIKWICENVFEANPDNVMSIGDNINDIPMFKECNFSYAMDNSAEAVKKNSNFYTSSVEQNGLGEALEDYAFRTRFLK
ncbi:Cof-type HAD-IIB family hydrolase [Mycoplasma sp. Mirounga ES2805-ORL]|uniref:Cof-type HAD-IIB family hydrolase n=1 Tax=Mycoplasma sp. Mirounga ES2805-ORL TaxID=754514 RepID=UPI00197B5C66|nr:HAD family hydrolase [Mycoplasma sp. Mirounga ES2805-ORL]QSF13390.1 HAD family phosphatase [Mycoplasma sp. Mirounga ES2805-ORL]